MRILPQTGGSRIAGRPRGGAAPAKPSPVGEAPRGASHAFMRPVSRRESRGCAFANFDKNRQIQGQYRQIGSCFPAFFHPLETPFDHPARSPIRPLSLPPEAHFRRTGNITRPGAASRSRKRGQLRANARDCSTWNNSRAEFSGKPPLPRWSLAPLRPIMAAQRPKRRQGAAGGGGSPPPAARRSEGNRPC